MHATRVSATRHDRIHTSRRACFCLAAMRTWILRPTLQVGFAVSLTSRAAAESLRHPRSALRLAFASASCRTVAGGSWASGCHAVAPRAPAGDPAIGADGQHQNGALIHRWAPPFGQAFDVQGGRGTGCGRGTGQGHWVRPPRRVVVELDRGRLGSSAGRREDHGRLARPTGSHGGAGASVREGELGRIWTSQRDSGHGEACRTAVGDDDDASL